MIVEVVLGVLMDCVNWIIAFLPSIESLPSWVTDTITLISFGLQIFPVDVWIVLLIHLVLWTGGSYIWAVVEWVYKKIPGVD